MNKNLSKEIVKHIFANFGIIPSDFVNQDNFNLFTKTDDYSYSAINDALDIVILLS